MRVLVTGGGGFLGHAVVSELRARGHDVRSASRNEHGELDALGVRQHRVDLAEGAGLGEALHDCDAVAHVAARTGVWGPRPSFFRTNVEGTRNLLAAARAAGVRRFVYTSSPSVVFDGRDHLDAGPELPYPARYLCAYPETKAIAEREVLAANGDGFATCALRPHLIVGPRDPHLVPRLLERAATGKLAVVGPGDNRVSLCHVENAARAHALAVERLGPEARCAGRAYFVVQDEDVALWAWIASLLERVGLPPVTRRVPLGLAYAGGALLEGLWRLRGKREEPPMTRFVALQLARSHTYSLAPLRLDLGYTEAVDVVEATRRLVAQHRPS